jgi:hypothetical protein
MPLSGEQVRGRRTCEVLERGGTSREGATGPRARQNLTEGATGPRARWNLTRGGDCPSSEAGPHPRGPPALERGRGLLVRCRTPRAKQSSARGWLGRLSGGPLGPPGPWAREFILSVFEVCLCFVFCESKWVFPDFLGDPYGCHQQ